MPIKVTAVYVYLVSLYTTGQRWHSFVCATPEAAERSLARGYGITQTVELPNNPFRHFGHPTDPSQTAIVQKTTLIQ